MSDSPVGLRNLAKFVGVLILVDVIAVYAFSLASKNSWPPSHPWPGITLSLFGICMAVARWDRTSQFIATVMSAMALLSAILWTTSAMGMRAG